METELEEEIKELVIARLKTLPEGMGVSMGSMGNFNKEELISHVDAGDEIGKKIMEVEMSFLRALKDGMLYESPHPSNPS